MRDLKNNIDLQHALPPAARTTGTATGTAVNLSGYQGAVAIFNVGDWTDGTHTPSLFESADGTTYTAVAAGDLDGTFTPVAGTAQENAVQKVGYMGNKQYIKPMIVSGSSTTGMVAGAMIVRGIPYVRPVA